MSSILAKIKRRSSWVSIQDQVTIPDWESIQLDNTMAFNPNNTADGIWFYIEDFNSNDAFIEFLGQDTDTADLTHLERNEFAEIDIIAFSHDNKYYLQKVSKGSYINRNAIIFGDTAELRKVKNTIYINPLPNCIYDKHSHRLYFKEFCKATSIFDRLKLDYKTATNEEVQTFFDLRIVNPTGLTTNNVSIQNRKRITAVLDKYNNLSEAEKTTMKDYIREMTNGHITYDEETQTFETPDDNTLRIVLYGLQGRFYLPPLETETQVATSTTGMDSLL